MQSSSLVVALLALVVGGGVGYVIRNLLAQQRKNSAELEIKQSLLDAKNEAKETLLEAKDKAVKILEDAKNQERERLAILARQEDRLNLQFKKIEQREAELEDNKRDLERQADKDF